MSSETYIASPSVVAYAGRKKIDLSDVARKSGRLTLAKEDVDSHMNQSAPTASLTPAVGEYWDVDHAAFGPVSTEPLSRMARVASANLSAANAMIPQVTHHDRADMRRLEAFRGSQKAEAARRGVRLTALAFHVKALAICLQEFPRFNASLSPDGGTLVLKHYVHIGIAVDTPHGLLVPVIRDADKKGVVADRGQHRRSGDTGPGAQDPPGRNGRRLDVDLEPGRHRRNGILADCQSARTGDTGNHAHRDRACLGG